MGGRRACVLTKRSQGAVEGGEERARGGYLSGRRSRGRDYHISRRTRHELQAHHGHVALLNRPRAGV